MTPAAALSFLSAPSASPWRVRRAAPADAVNLAALEIANGLSSFGAGMLREKLAQATSLFLLAESAQGSLLGFFSASIVVDELQIDNVVVTAAARGQSIGTALVCDALQLAQQSGLAQAVLEVRASNVVAQRLYQRCGFAKVGERKRYYAQPLEDAWVMIRTFNGIDQAS